MQLLKLIPRFREARAAIEGLQERTQWDRATIESHQLTRINELWSDASTNVAWYRDLKQQHSLPDSFANLQEFCERMPALSKQTVRVHRDLLLSDNAASGKWLRTGGSTGEPTSVFWSREAHLANLRNRYRWQAEHGVDFLDRHAFIWGHAGSFAPGIRGVIARLRRPIEDTIRKRLRLSAYSLGTTDLDKYLQQISHYKPTFIYGYSSAVFLLAQRAVETGIKCDSLKMLIMTAEPALPKYAATIKQAFNAKGLIEYGSVETGLVALQDEELNLRILDDSRFVETIPREDGGFDIAVTVLDNPSFPLLRYLVGDITSEPIATEPACFSILKNVQGRSNDYLVSRGGRLVHSLAVKHTLEDIEGVVRFQAMQKTDGSLTIKIELRDLSVSIDEARICENVSALLDGYHVSVEKVETIAGNLAGKHRWIISELFEKI